MNNSITVDGVKYTRNGADFDQQIDSVLSFLGPEMKKALRESNAMIAGGAITSAFTHAETKDVDVYFRSTDDLRKAFLMVTRQWEGIYLSHTDKSVTIKDKETGTTVQFIYFDHFSSPEEVFKAFDFTVCMGAIEFSEAAGWQLVLHPSFLSDVASRTLHFNPGTRYPYISLVRTRKYKEKGYKIGKGNLIAIGIACSGVPITSWEGAKEQLGGVYGYEIDLKADDEEPFSLDKLYDVISSVKDTDRPYVVSDYTDLYQDLTGINYEDYAARSEYEKEFDRVLNGVDKP